MSAAAAAAAGPTVGQRLLERSVGYARTSLDLVRPESLRATTPCRGWDVATLLGHLEESVEALYEAAALGLVGLDVAPVDQPLLQPSAGGDVVARLRARTTTLLAAWGQDDAGPVSVGGVALHPGTVAGAGALELAVHGWDLAAGCGRRRPLPADLARDLLDVVPLLVGDDDRPWRFAQPVPVARDAPPGDRLVALLGRRP